MLIDFFL